MKPVIDVHVFVKEVSGYRDKTQTLMAVGLYQFADQH